jgi:predicted aconitase
VQDGPALEDADRAMLDGALGDAVALAMRVVVGTARASRAPRLISVESAHIDGCLYHGKAGLDFAERLVALGGRVAVPTTLNVGSLDLLHPGLVRADADLADAGRRLMDAYVALGCAPTWTCAPYQISHRPAAGTHVAWAESNAIAFVNSVLGARSDRYGDFLDIAAALTGRAPDAGLHRDEHRRARVVLDCSALPRELLGEDSAWAALGCLLGETAGTQVAALTGLPGDLGDGGTTEDRLKALGATAASAGGVALFHVVGVTPEAPDIGAVLADGGPERTVRVDAAALRAARDRLSTASAGRLDAVSLGTPHFSVSEFAALAALVSDGVPFAPEVDVYVSTSRAVLAESDRLGYVEPVRRAGARVLTDTCTYVTPVLRPGTEVVMTNSGKWAWYAPGNLGIDTVLGSLEECVLSARAGRVVRDESLWG